MARGDVMDSFDTFANSSPQGLKPSEKEDVLSGHGGERIRKLIGICL
jgi:hypothetical protein